MDDDTWAALCAARERMMSYCAARRFEAVAALIRHRPAPGREARVPGGLPGLWQEFTGTEVAHALAGSRSEGETLVETAYDLLERMTGHLPAGARG